MYQTLAQRAGATRSRKWAKGLYVTPSQKAAFKRYLAGVTLTAKELALLASHPHLTSGQRAQFLALALEA